MRRWTLITAALLALAGCDAASNPSPHLVQGNPDLPAPYLDSAQVDGLYEPDVQVEPDTTEPDTTEPDVEEPPLWEEPGPMEPEACETTEGCQAQHYDDDNFWCDEETSTCSECSTGADCASPMLCSSGRCVQCEWAADCEGYPSMNPAVAPFCLGGRCGGCETNDQCASLYPDTPFCIGAGFCVECSPVPDYEAPCPSGTYCLPPVDDPQALVILYSCRVP